MATNYDNISQDLVWEVCPQQAGGVQLSRDPLNLVNKHSRKYEGFVNDQAIGINRDDNTVKMTTKLPKRKNNPAKIPADAVALNRYQESSFAASTPARKVYKSVVNSTAKKGYRADLRAEAVARASAIKRSQREKKDKTPPTKLRGAKAVKAEQAKAAAAGSS
ncbi:hypothetical protein D0868_06146 [Hortaea werneckii]|uniref:Ribosomal eL28/Mak16 domain-containing protein n=1 Tax=Hortaea werneckii TaxID=91943 RepID=A0A3M6YS78_HORWE|nr:hypothetical protein D0868_06146 [Hortaea werneckii]